MLICTYTYEYICSVCIRNYQNIHLNNIAFKFFTVQDRPRRDATTLLSVKSNHKISQTTTNYHSTTSFYYCLYNRIDQEYHTSLIHVTSCRFFRMYTSCMSSWTVPMIASYTRSQHTTCCSNGVIYTEHFLQLAAESFWVRYDLPLCSQPQIFDHTCYYHCFFFYVILRQWLNSHLTTNNDVTSFILSKCI